ncbi:MAG: TldD/PmbA family protein [Anaerolineae bacterium]|nr:MAG: TldD/PmbA family protein [Anaerolineae bacterium]
MLGEAEIKAIADRVLSYCRADAAELVISSKLSDLTRFYRNSVHQNVEEKEVRVHLKAWVGNRQGMASTNALSDESLREVADRAAEMARVGPEHSEAPNLYQPAKLSPVVALDPAVSDQSPRARAEAVRQVCQAAAKRGQEAYGAYLVEVKELAAANSEGHFGYHVVSMADFQTVVRNNGASGWAQASHWRLEEVPVRSLGEEAIHKATDAADPQTLEPEPLTVVLDPYATADFLLMLALPGMSARAVADGRSWISERIGQRAMSQAVSIWDDGLDLGGVPQPFDAEGTPKQKLDIVREGVVIGAVHDRDSAAIQGAQSSGHALSPDYPPMIRVYSPLPTNLFMAPGDKSTQELIESTERGLYITRFHYTRQVHPRDCVVTGMTRDGVFLIEGGKIQGPVKDLRFTQSYVEALNSVEAIGSEVRLMVDDFLHSAVSAPSIKIRDFKLTGATV